MQKKEARELEHEKNAPVRKHRGSPGPTNSKLPFQKTQPIGECPADKRGQTWSISEDGFSLFLGHLECLCSFAVQAFHNWS